MKKVFSKVLIFYFVFLLYGYGKTWKQAHGLVLFGDIITMDEAQGVIKDGILVVKNKKIIYLGSRQKPFPEYVDTTNAVVINTNGYIYPGLIDAHSHVAYNFLPLYRVPKSYSNRYQWTSHKLYRQYVNGPKKLLTKKEYYNYKVEVIKYAEVKALSGGVTSIQGTPNLKAVSYLVRNIENMNFGQDRISQHGLALTDARFVKSVPTGLLKQMQENKIDAWLCHLAEGTDDKMRSEFQILKDLSLLGDKTIGIHSTALRREHFREMAESGTKIVWSPTSNLLLYGATADIPSALDEECLVCLGADWSPSGCKNLLGELKVAHNIDSITFGDRISDTLLIEMVTINPSYALGLEDKIGMLRVGMYADLAIFEKISDNPYTSLIHANERHVILVLVDGEPLYGDPLVMDLCKSNDYELIKGPTFAKALDITNPEYTKGDMTFNDIKNLLSAALEFNLEHMWETFGESFSKMDFDSVEAFADYLDSKFPQGFVPLHLDPIFAYGDTIFFNGLRNSTIANFQFNLQKYWPDKDPLDTDQKIIAFVNKSTTNFQLLDIDVGLDKRAARNIISQRDGPDLIPGTADDALFESINELDAVKYVSIGAIGKLEAYILALPENNDAAMIEFLNSQSTSFTVLDSIVGLDKRAARNLIHYRNGPDKIFGTEDDNRFDSIQEIDRVRFVGEKTIEKIRGYVLIF